MLAMPLHQADATFWRALNAPGALAPKQNPERPDMITPQQSTSALTLHTPVLPRLPDRILRMVAAIYAAHGGAECMTLGEWHDVEEELNSRLESEYYEQQQ